ncbi:MAG: signal peptidase [Acidimicrobiales bacterium]|nr:signal peptidase [Acidimicrobiales bacterium]
MTLPASDTDGTQDGHDASWQLDRVTDEEIAAARAARTARLEARQAAEQPPVDEPPNDGRTALGWGLLVGGAILLSLLVRVVAFEQFWIPSPSMSDTLVRKDRVLVNKLAYRFHDVHRGDVVVFERPENQQGGTKDLIKRVVGLPGEHVAIIDGGVRIDGRLLDEPYTDGLQTEANIGCGVADTGGIDSAAGLRIPDGEVLVLGDNRINSQDGRCFGPIDVDLIVGRAFLIVWPPTKMGGL